MTDTIPPLTEADVKALGFIRFGREREDDMGGSLAHKDGEAFYMQRAGAFWSVDPEYGNMRNVLCEAPPNWRDWRAGCIPLLHYTGRPRDVYVWRVSALPADRLERLFNHDTIAPVLAGLKAQAEALDIADHPVTKNRWETKVTPGDWAGNAPTEPSAPTKRRPLVVGDRILGAHSGTVEVTELGRFQFPDGQIFPCVYAGGTWYREDSAYLILPREGGADGDHPHP